MLDNQGDQIQFVSDTHDDWPFSEGLEESALSYPDKTDEIINSLIDQGILKDNGMLFVDDQEPDTIYTRDIINIWPA